ncbi:hypothetical protein [Numidum massiliense]|uniref:hypothetical protein n=1 Tax=Numidum massiliense TaxID=1522315 RepID=UPI0006D5750E|nr:hypothetical protein [Numidum massiliense]
MEDKLTTSIVLYGEIEPSDTQSWLNFYNYCIDLAASINFPPNYLGISGESFRSGKILTINRAEKRLLKSLERKEEINSLEIYSLPEDFTTAAFDYNVYICRESDDDPTYLMLTFPSESFDKVYTPELLSQLKNFVDFQGGQVFKMSNLESPLFYASKANPPSVFKTLEVIREF